MTGKFNPAAHPRGPNGRFTKSYARPLSSSDKANIAKFRAGLSPHKPFGSAKEAGDFLSQFSADKPAQSLEIGGVIHSANKQLRSGKTDGLEVNAIKSAMTETPEDVQVFRKVPKRAFGKVDPKSLVGMEVSDAGFFPTTLAPPRRAPGDVMMHIAVPKDTPAAPVPDGAGLVLDNGTRMSVDEVVETPAGVDMHLTAVPKKLTFADLAKKAGPAKKAQPAKAQPAAAPPTPKLQAPPASPQPAKAAPVKATPTKATKAAAKTDFSGRVKAAAQGSKARAAAPNSLVNDRPPPMSTTQRRALEEYKGNDYTAINRGLRTPPPNKKSERAINNIDSVMAQSRLQREIAGYRGVTNASRLFGDRLNGDMTGMEWREDAYVSTSTDRSVSADFASDTDDRSQSVLMRVVIPRGTGAVELSGPEYESEVMLQRGLRMRVVADRGRSPEGFRLIDVEVVPG